jgi:hypothetical protein
MCFNHVIRRDQVAIFGPFNVLLCASDSDHDVELSAFHTNLYVSTHVFASLLNDVHASPTGSLLGLLTAEAL